MAMTAPVVRLSETPGTIRFTGRHLGADTREVLPSWGARRRRSPAWSGPARP